MNQYYRIMSSSHYVIVMHSDGSGNNGGISKWISKRISERTSWRSTVKHNSELLPVLLSPIIGKASGDILVEYFK